MLKIHKDYIKKNRRIFVTDLAGNIGGILDSLLAAEVLTTEMVSRIKANRVQEEAVRDLLDLIIKRGPKAFDDFNDALVNNGFQHLTDLKQTIYKDNPLEQPEDATLPDEWPDKTFNGLIASVIPIDAGMKNVKYPDKVYTPNTTGRVVIINNEKFSGKNRNDDAICSIDPTTLDRLFKRLNFTTKTKTDLKAEEIETLMTNEAQKSENENIDCFILFVLSYGDNDKVFYGTDMKPVTAESIYKTFNGNNCPSLASKPKLFFIQATPMAKMKEDETDGMMTDAQLIPQQMQMLTLDTPSYAHFYMVYSSSAGFTENNHGTLFIQTLVYVFSNFANRCDLKELMMKVRNLLQKAKDGPFKINKSTLVKSLYFFPQEKKFVI